MSYLSFFRKKGKEIGKYLWKLEKNSYLCLYN